MLLTEQEASEKWCSFAHVIAITPNGGAVSAGFNRTIQGGSQIATPHAPDATLSIPQAAQCIGSACMQWRWVDPDTTTSGRRGCCGRSGNPMTFYALKGFI